MESVSISQILHDVRIILDQNAEGYDVAGVGEYTLEMNDVIYKAIVPAVQWAHMNAPLFKLKGVDFATEATLDDNLLTLPTDFMRLVTLRGSTWDRAITSYYMEDDPEVSQMLSSYPGLRPTEKKPAAVYTNEDGDRCLLLFPFPSGTQISSARYIPFPAIDVDSSSTATYVDNTIEIEPAVYQAFLYYLAHLVKMSYNEDNKFAEQAQALL